MGSGLRRSLGLGLLTDVEGFEVRAFGLQGSGLSLEDLTRIGLED